MYVLRYFHPVLRTYQIQIEGCWHLALKEARSINQIYKQPVEIYERKEVI